MTEVLNYTKKNIIITAPGLSENNKRLQPWRYVLELANAFSKTDSCKCIIFTNGDNRCELESLGNNLDLVKTKYLSVYHQANLKELIDSFSPLQLWWSVTPRSIPYSWLLAKIECKKYAFITCPFYSFSQLFRASLHGVPYREMKALWWQRLVPRTIFKNFLQQKFWQKIFVQTSTNLNALGTYGVAREKLGLIPVGIDVEDKEGVYQGAVEYSIDRSVENSAHEVEFLFLGSTKIIRGFRALLDAFTLACSRGMRAKLNILARGASDREVANIQRDLRKRGIENFVRVKGGWLDPEDLRMNIRNCDVVVLPFILVPSEVPIAILEAMCQKKPVIGPTLDGVIELVKDGGKTVDTLDIQAFSVVLEECSLSRSQLRILGERAYTVMRKYPSWDDVGNMAKEEAMLT